MDFYLNKFIEMSMPAACVIIIISLGCLMVHFIFHIKVNMKRIIPYTIMTMYLFVLMATAVFEREWNSYDMPRINLVPLYDLRRTVVRQERAILMLVLNILVFVPWGILLPILYRPFKKFGWVLLAGLGLSLAIETTQLIGKMGIFETDDLIFNTLGTILGFLLYQICGILFHSKKIRKGDLH